MPLKPKKAVVVKTYPLQRIQTTAVPFLPSFAFNNIKEVVLKPKRGRPPKNMANVIQSYPVNGKAKKTRKPRKLKIVETPKLNSVMSLKEIALKQVIKNRTSRNLLRDEKLELLMKS
jgi:hypothetical protein